jgi:hypothetical protein
MELMSFFSFDNVSILYHDYIEGMLDDLGFLAGKDRSVMT